MKDIQQHLSGILKQDFSKHKTLKLIQSDGLQVDLVGRLGELAQSFPDYYCQLNYFVSKKPTTVEGIKEGWLSQLFGSIEAEHGTDVFSGSSMTGSWTEDFTTLQIGGHDLFRELSLYEDNFIVLELNLTHKSKFKSK